MQRQGHMIAEQEDEEARLDKGDKSGFHSPGNPLLKVPSAKNNGGGAEGGRAFCVKCTSGL